ncbi:MAG: PhzF family phenazine biosynthesis protein [Oscillospiraceae bacterium]|jgi:PhzF family phenazine biosynthesis protein
MILYLVQAFSDNASGGNGAGVAISEDGRLPSEKFMLETAALLGFSETAFLAPVKGGWRIRYFTPVAEIDLCGHATVAAGRVLRESGVPDGDYMFQTNAGELRVTVGETVTMDMTKPECLKVIESPEEIEVLMGALGGNSSMLIPGMYPEIITTGLPDIIVPLRSAEALAALCPDTDALKNISRDWDCVSVHAFALGDDCDARCRDFAPIVGVAEESATGTASGALTHYLHRRNLLTPPSTAVFIQGESMSRPSQIKTELRTDGSIRVGGKAYILGRKRIFEEA